MAESTEYNCEICSRTFKSQKLFQMHQKRNHTESYKPLKRGRKQKSDIVEIGMPYSKEQRTDESNQVIHVKKYSVNLEKEESFLCAIDPIPQEWFYIYNRLMSLPVENCEVEERFYKYLLAKLQSKI